uniref:PH domain-containing protein n=1 Tax=Panagrolaimus sp. JU765 TaxID=591449 RepID=A0AC34R0H6_9BILA
MTENGYENISELIEQSERLSQRYDCLTEPCQIRSDNLKDAMKFYQWSNEASEQIEWLRELIPQLKSSDYGNTLNLAQSLNKKHGILEQDIKSREPLINQVKMNGYSMKNSGHYAKQQIDVILTNLREEFDLVQTLAKERSLKLSESLLSQQYYAECGEAINWMKERLPKVNNQELGHNQATADAHLRRLLILEEEIYKFEPEIKRLHQISENLVKTNHFDSTQLTTIQASMEELYQTLQIECKNRKTRLGDASRYYSFVRQVDDLTVWLREKQRLAMRDDYGRDLEECQALIEQFDQVHRELSSAGERVHAIGKIQEELLRSKNPFASTMRDDYGRDLEECQALIEQFDQVHRELSSAGERVHAIGKIQEELLRSKNPFASSIRALGGELQELWRQVNQSANEQQQALLDAKNVHMFDQDADELLNRLVKKEAEMVSLQNEDLTVIDFESVKRFVQIHEEFLRGLFILEKQVMELCKEADRMISQFPRTQEHIEHRRIELEEEMKDIQDETRKFQEKLHQAKNNQAYFQDYRDLMSWIRQMESSIIGEILPRDLQGCEALNVRHDEYKAEILTREPQKTTFVIEGKKMITTGNVLSTEIGYKIEDLENGFRDLMEIWNSRKEVYDMNLDVQQWLYQANFLEKWLCEREKKWLCERESLLKEDWKNVDSVETIENMIRQFEDFWATLIAQSDQFESLKRLTKVEQAFSQVKSREQEIVNRRESQVENRRDTQQIKTLEKKKILQEKRQERERRKTQEISIIKRTPSQEATQTTTEFISTTLPRTRNRTGSTSSDNIVISTVTQLPTLSNEFGEVTILKKSTEMIAGTSETLPRPSKTPGFTTRRTQSIKSNRSQGIDMNAIDMHGYLERKNDLQSGGKRATVRSWKRHYTILCGQLLCFFKDYDSYMSNMADAPPIYIHQATCAVTSKKPNAFVLHTQDGAVYYFACCDNLTDKKEANQKLNYGKMIEWVEKINFHAGLEPKNQLKSFKEVADEFPLHTPPPRPEEYMRSRTLEHHPSTSSSSYDRHSITLDNRRTSDLPQTGNFASETLAYTTHEIRSSIEGGSERLHQQNSSDFDDTESVKKSRGFSAIFKRGSKHSK